MRKHILPLLLAAAFLFLGFSNANAAGTAVTFTNVNTSPVLLTQSLPTTTNAIVYGCAGVVTGNTANFAAFNFTSTGASAPNVTTATFTLYYGVVTTGAAAPTLAACTAIATATAPTTVGATLSFGTPGGGFAGNAYSAAAGKTAYFYVVENFTDPSTPPGSISFTLAANATVYNSTITATITPTYSGSFAGNVYTWPSPVTGTAASLTTVAGNNGTSSPSTISTTGNYTIYGMSITPSATGAATNITKLTFTTSSANGNSYFYGTAYLYTGTSATSGPVTQVSSTTTTTATTFSFTTFTTTQTLTSTGSGGGTLYYYVVIVYNPGVTATAGTTLSFTSATGPTITNGSIAGPAYTFNPPPAVTATAASLTTAVNTSGLANSPIATANNYAIYGMSLTPSATGATKALTGLTFTATASPAQFANYFYATAYLYASTSSTFSTTNGTATQISTVTTTGSNTLSFTGFTTAQNITAGTTVYYYVYIVYSAPGVAATATQYLTYTSATTAATVTAGASISGPTYTYNPIPAVTATYYWTGNGATSDWKNKANWQTSATAGSYINAGSYPGATTSDVAIFNLNYFAYYINNGFDNGETPTIGAYNIVVNTMTVLDQAYITLTVNSSYSLTTTTLNVNATGTTGNNGDELTVVGTLSTTTTPILTATGVTTIGYDAELYVPAMGIVNFPLGSSVTMTGNANNVSELYSDGGSVTSTSSTFTLSGAGAFIEFDGGSFTNTTSTFTLSGKGTEIISDGGNINFNTASTINVTGAVANSGDLCGLVVANDNGVASMNINSASVVNMGTTAANGVASEIAVVGNTLNVNSSTINLNGSTSVIYNQEQYVGQYSIINVNTSTINLGTTAISGSGATSEIYNSAEANFNLNAASVINMNGANSEIANTGYKPGGTTYYGVVTCASTSVINPSSTTAVIVNNVPTTVANSGSYFTLLSDANGAATIGKLATGAKLTGYFNVQRYLTGGASYLRNYRLLSSPVNKSSATSNATNLLDLSYLGASATIPYSSPTITYNGAFIAGPGTTFGGGIHTIANPLMYLYQENIVPGTAYNAQFTSGKNVGITSLNTTTFNLGTTSTAAGAGSGSATTSPSAASTAIALPGYDNSASTPVLPGNAYLLYYIDNNARTAAASTQSVPNSSNVTASGYINQAQVQLYMWGSDSPNLTDTYGLSGVRLPGITVVGNPYPSTIDLKQVWTDNSTTITPSLYQLDVTNQQFDSYNASTGISSTSLSSEYVASGQGFYIHVDSLGSTKTFYFKEDQKTASTTAAFFPPISNFAVVHPYGKTVDNVSLSSNSRSAADDISSSQGKIANNSATNNTQKQNIAALSIGSRTLNNASTNKAVSGAPVLHKSPQFLASKIVNPVIPPDNVTPETPQPTPKTVAKSIVNPAGLHLKFVVDSVDNDEVGIYFNKAWSDNFDANDSKDLDGLSGKVYLSSYSSDDIRTSVNALGDYTGGKKVKLFVKAAATGIYKVQMTDIANFDTADYSVFLLDKFKADSLDLTLYKSYNFNYTPGTANDSTRFVLAIEHKPVPYYALLTFAGEKVTPGVQLNWQTKNNGNNTTFVLQKLNASNVYVPIDSLQSDSSGEFSYIDQHPTLGNNTYRLQQTSELGKITYSAPVTIGYNSTSPNGGLTIYPNPSRDIITVTLSTSSIATTVATADIYNMSGTLIEHKAVSSNSFTHDISSYQLGVYIIELKNSNGVLVGKSKFVKVN